SRRVLRPAGLLRQVHPGAGGGPRAAAARPARLPARRQPGLGAFGHLCPASLPAQDRRIRLVLGLASASAIRSRPMLKKPLAILCTVLGLSGCAGVSPEVYRTQTPTLDLATYFNGPLTA